jgi:hypothetical protein
MRMPPTALASLVALAACTGGPPHFRVEPSAAGIPERDAGWLSVGSLSTPPPGDYRFARLNADGTGEARELFTSSGPGRWLSFTGRVRVDPTTVQAALAAAVRPGPMADDRQAPCVLAVHSAAAEWEGCAHPAIAASLLAVVPRLTRPDVAPTCNLPVCQIRIVREVKPVRHEQYGELRQEMVLDATGVFWCAAGDGRPAGRTATLRVERGRIPEADAAQVFRWVLGTRNQAVPGIAGASSGSAADAVLVRRRDADWAGLPDQAAQRVRARWRRLASGLPRECRPDG